MLRYYFCDCEVQDILTFASQKDVKTSQGGNEAIMPEPDDVNFRSEIIATIACHHYRPLRNAS